MRSHTAKGILAILVVAAWHAGAARIESFSPTGYTKDVVQVAVRFSEPMVALGDPGIADPFVVECGVPGNGRWIDERNWVYDFAYDVPSAERCRFSLRRGVRTLAGERLTGPREHVFHTGGPTIIDGPIGSSHTWTYPGRHASKSGTCPNQRMVSRCRWRWTTGTTTARSRQRRRGSTSGRRRFEFGSMGDTTRLCIPLPKHRERHRRWPPVFGPVTRPARLSPALPSKPTS